MGFRWYLTLQGAGVDPYLSMAKWLRTQYYCPMIFPQSSIKAKFSEIGYPPAQLRLKTHLKPLRNTLLFSTFPLSIHGVLRKAEPAPGEIGGAHGRGRPRHLGGLKWVVLRQIRQAGTPWYPPIEQPRGLLTL